MNCNNFGTILEWFLLEGMEGLSETASLPHKVGVRPAYTLPSPDPTSMLLVSSRLYNFLDVILDLLYEICQYLHLPARIFSDLCWLYCLV